MSVRASSVKNMSSPAPLPSRGSPITAVQLKCFTAFDDLTVKLGPGVNLFIGESATGKTHLLKAMYMLAGAGSGVFGQRLGWSQLRRRGNVRHDESLLRWHRGDDSHTLQSFANCEESDGVWSGVATLSTEAEATESLFIPSKEILEHARGFVPEVLDRLLDFDHTYLDIVRRAQLPGSSRASRKTRALWEPLLGRLGGAMPEYDEQRGFLLDGLDFSLVSEGWRKLALLILLLRNGSLGPNTLLLWDEPEANLNPQQMGDVVDLVLRLTRLGAQVLIATHNDFVLKEFDLHCQAGDSITYHSLFKDAVKGIQCNSTMHYLDIEPNPLHEMRMEQYRRSVSLNI